MELLAQAYCYPWGGGWYCSSPPGGTEYGSGTGDLTNLGTILTGSGSGIGLTTYAFAIAGVILIFMIIVSGYQLLMSAGNPEGLEKGKKRLTASLVGFILIFAAFWIWRLVEVLIGFQFTP